MSDRRKILAAESVTAISLPPKRSDRTATSTNTSGDEDFAAIRALMPGQSCWIYLLDATDLREYKDDGEGSLRVEVMRHWGRELCLELRLDEYDGDTWVQFEIGEFKAIWFTDDYRKAESTLGCFRHFADIQFENLSTEESNRLYRLKEKAVSDTALKVAA